MLSASYHVFFLFHCVYYKHSELMLNCLKKVTDRGANKKREMFVDPD